MSQNQPPRWQRRWTVAALAGLAAVSLGCSMGSDIIAYDVPPESARYTFGADIDGVHSEWEYTSERPAEDSAPEYRPCIGAMFVEQEPDPCRPEPLIFLRYDLDLGLDNTMPARQPAAVEITGYYQQLEDPPRVTELTLEASTDGGESWQQIATREAGDSTFRASISHRHLSGRPGDVISLRVNAVDDQGNTVVQTIPHAYALS